MRDIKFRGKCLDTGSWRHGDLVHRQNGKPFIRLHMNGGWVEYEVDPSTVGQYTGLHEKNGVEIYEGDIVAYFIPYFESDTGYSDWAKCYGVVSWSKENAAYVAGEDGCRTAPDSSVYSYSEPTMLASVCNVIEANTIGSFETLDPMTGEPDGGITAPIEPDNTDNNDNPVHNAEVIGNIHENPELIPANNPSQTP